ncbi:glycosyltransferase WbuB [Vibrio panuliri]|uniref:Glycosyltransferase WbuB n=1 Tax=Vibrio panuliri TaxID=1381081 RepID=A0A1Q9HAP2_9VIBR|nr:glycosyltransferase family 4 protein [Vibrio panuliri]OLQ86171.1 glycosyltransferase WbuB [Vibrio panuliri]
MHILFLTDNFPPESNAPASRTYEHAVRWIKSGHEVTVVTGAPNFPEGKVFKGFKNKIYSVSRMDGIKVVRVKTYITANEGFVKRILDYMSFMFSGFFAGLFQRKPDIIIATSPQFFCACAGWMLSVFKRKPFIFELRDIWPASITAVGAMNDNIFIRALECIELFLYRRSSAIITVTHAFKRELVERGIVEEKIHVVLNGVDTKKYYPLCAKDVNFIEKYHLQGKFVAGYVGTHGMAHGLETLIDVAEKLRKYRDIALIFAGGGAAKNTIVQLASKKKLTNVVFIERQTKEMMPSLWSVCDVAMVPLVNKDLFKTVIPSKIFECMAMGIPMILSVPEGEATSIVRKSGAGLVVESESAEQIKTAILTLYEDEIALKTLKENCLDNAPNYSRDISADKMLSILKGYC